MYYYTKNLSNTGWGQVCAPLPEWSVADKFIRQWKEFNKGNEGWRLGCYNTAITKEQWTARYNTCIRIWIFISKAGTGTDEPAWESEQPIHLTLSPFPVLHSLLSYIPLLLQSPFQCLFPLLHFPPTFSLKASPLFLDITRSIALPLKRHPPQLFHP